ncbi:MAG TPA: HAD-IA family hydrolase [Casimicrobiaceae bacterium]|nr:HAD-IA family hydrolase [Casimicrobiaceae bacterium]
MSVNVGVLVFDLDGTLSDPAVGIGRCMNHALRHHGHAAIAEADVPRYIGPPLEESFAAVVRDASAQHVAALVERYRERYGEIGYAENTIYAGIPEALAALRGAGATLGVCTAKRVDFAERILDHFGIRRHFAFVSGGDIGIPKAGQLAALLLNGVINREATMIGDRAVDIRAAKANGLRSVGVLWGHGGLAELRATDPDVLLESPAELPTLAATHAPAGERRADIH